MHSKIKNEGLIAFILSALGTCFLIYYIFRASLNVVVSDYIRLINYYLPNTRDLHLLLSWEGISRIPFAFLIRFINTEYFHFNVYLDKILGVFGLFIFNFVTVKYALITYKNLYIKLASSILITFISFSLMSWEMILNGTGYAHLLTTGFIAIVFYLYDDLFTRKKSSKFQLILIYIITILTSLCFAGQYMLGFLSTIIFFSAIAIIKNACGVKEFSRAISKHIVFIIISVICILCFFKSNSTGEAVIPVGMKNVSLIEVLANDITFPIRFLIKSLAGAVIGTETFDIALATGTINDAIIYLIGIIYLVIIVFTIIIIISKLIKSINTNIFPLMYFILGLGNFALIFLARYKFLDDTYGMSSRYSIQYMFLTIGVVLILMGNIDTLILNKKSNIKNNRIVASIVISILSISFLLTGHITTSIDEIFKADYRKIAYINLVGAARNYRDYSDEDLMNIFEYKRSAEQIRNAMQILEKNNLNVFYLK